MSLIKNTVKNFLRHHGTDLAAGLTYYAVFAIFPALLALLSLLAVVGEADSALNTVLDVLRPLMSQATLDDIEPVVRDLTLAQGAPFTLAAGVAVALWSASGYVGAFSRAMNTVREVEETRPFWKLRPLMVLITLVSVLLAAAALVIVVVTGPITESIGAEFGIGSDALDIWEIAKWPVLALIVVIIVALLFHATPNVKTGRIRLLSPGAFVAIVLWAAASTGFAFYVANFASYNKTYGSVAGVVVGLLWLWLTNVALVFGAELDAAREKAIAEREAPAAAMTAEHAPEAAEPEGAGAAGEVAGAGAGALAAADATGAEDSSVEEPEEEPEEELDAELPPPEEPEDFDEPDGPADQEPIEGEAAEGADAPAAAPTGRRWGRSKPSEQFPRKSGSPPYGPRPQPVPDED